MDYRNLNKELGNIDLYLLDQVLKGRFDGRKDILDAGCGEGRNLKYLINEGYSVYGVDIDPMAIKLLQMTYKDQKEHFTVGRLEELEFDQTFDIVICSAVLHFAADEQHFQRMFESLYNALKPGGILFVRMATTVGLSQQAINESGFTYQLTQDQYKKLIKHYNLSAIEPFKTVLVDSERSMGVFVLEK